MKEWTDVIDRMGWPAAGLIFLIVVEWRFWVFWRPYVVRFFDAQLDLIETVKTSSQKSAEATERIGDNMELLNKRHDRHDEQLQVIRTTLERKA